MNDAEPDHEPVAVGPNLHKAPPPLLHLLSGDYPHADALVIGTREALVCLIAALQEAASAGIAVVRAMHSDGEHYDLKIEMRDEARMDDAPLPYRWD